MKLPKALNEATAGAALKYHIKRALERSHSISEFSKQLELSAQNAKFSNNTLKIIEELNNGVKQASDEIKEKATKYEKALQELQKIDESKLSKEQQQVLKVFKGELDEGEIKKIDLNDLYILEQGSRHAGAKKILVKHYGEESTGGLTNDELINISEVIKNGSVLLESLKKINEGFRYGYEWENNGVKLRLVIDDLNNGNKIFDFHSDRNFTDFRDARPQPSTSKDNGTQPITLNEPNPTPKPLNSQEDLLKNTENLNETTPKAKQYIDIAKGFDNLFRNDATIARKINYTTTKDIKSPLATSLEGALNQKVTQRLVSNIVRNIPTTYIFKKLDELSGGAALKYHIQRALERSHTISDFTKNLEISTKNSKFSNATMRKIEEITQGVKSAKENITKQEEALQDAITPLKQFGNNYAEFVLKPKEALEKLLQEKNGQVAGAAFRDDLGGIDFVWGKDGKDGYGLAHILEKREKQYTRLGLNAEQIKERTDELLKSIPEVIENGTLFTDDLGRVSVELNNIRVGLKNTWDNNNLNNHFVVTSYERDEKVLRELETKPPFSNDYKGNSNYSALNLNKNNSTKESLTSQEPPLSILEKSQLEKRKKLESERLAKAEKERLQKIKDKEEKKLKAEIRAQKNAILGKSELDREISKSENIPYKELKNAPKTSVSLNDDEIHLLKFVIVNKSDLKPNFKNTGTQTRTAVDSKKVEEIAERFDPKLIIGRGGFDDLPIILKDGQIIAGNHRTQGMLNFNAESRKKYEQAIKENFNIELKPDELLVRMPKQELNDKEIFKLASKSNENRANSFSDTLLSAMSSYNDKLKQLAPKFESDSVENLANQVARALEKDAKIPSHNQVENANIALLSHYARNTPNNSFLEVFDNAYKNLDRDQFKAFKEMFAYNSANFHNLNNDTMLKKFTISPYLTDALDTSAKMLESGNRADNYSKLVNDINYLVNSTDENGMNAFIKENKDAYHSVISELLGSSFARFLRLENPSAQFYEFLVKAKDRMIENAADIFSGTIKPIHQINIFDFIKYGIESGKSSKESRELLDLLPKLEKKFNAHEKFLQGDKK
ncbi:DUF3519 domain-containing protein [Helicobacter pylori]